MSKNNTGKKPLYKKWQLWALAAVAVCAIGVNSLSDGGVAEAPPSPSQDFSLADSQESVNVDVEHEEEATPSPSAEDTKEAPITPLPPEPAADALVDADPEAAEEQPSQEPPSDPPAESTPAEPSPDPPVATVPAEPSSDPEPSAATQSRTVYITKTGKRYHYNDHCNGGTYFEATLDDALSRGLTPCKKCVG